MKFDKENISNTKRITVFGGVNVIESDEILFKVAEEFSKLSEKLNFNYVFKASFLRGVVFPSFNNQKIYSVIQYCL